MTAKVETMETVVTVRDLTRRFGSFTAVDQVSFDIRRGEIFGFLGPNGAGKSTTIRMLCGLLSSSAGSATVAGFDINRQPEQVRLNIGYMSQKFSLYMDLTVGENLAFFGGVYGLAGDRLRTRAAAVLEQAGLTGQEGQLTAVLSGAVRQRLALACAVLHEPPILFLDEPTSGIDPVARRRFWEMIRDMSDRGGTILVTTHFLDEAEYCHRIGFISAGRLVALDTPARLRADVVREDIFEVEFSGAADVLTPARQLPGVLAASYFGRAIHMFCEPGRYRAPELTAALAAAGLAVRSVQPAPVRLEDVFVRLVQRQTEAPA